MDLKSLRRSVSPKRPKSPGSKSPRSRSTSPLPLRYSYSTAATPYEEYRCDTVLSWIYFFLLLKSFNYRKIQQMAVRTKFSNIITWKWMPQVSYQQSQEPERQPDISAEHLPTWQGHSWGRPPKRQYWSGQLRWVSMCDRSTYRSRNRSSLIGIVVRCLWAPANP